MEPFFLLNTILVFLATALGFWLGFWVYLANRKDRVNQAFFLMTIFVILWVNFAYFCNSLNLGDIAQIWAKLGYGMASLFFIPFYFFSISFPKKEKRSLVLDILVSIVCLILFFLSIFTNLLVRGVEFTKWGVLPLLGRGTIVYFVAIFLLTLFIISHLFRKYLKSTRKEKGKVQYLLIGLFIFIIANIIFNVALPFWQGIPQYYQFGNYSVVFLLTFTAYAIVKQELFGIKVVVTTIFVGLTAISLVLDALVFTDILVLQLFKVLILAIFLYLGYALIKSVLKEIKQRQEIERLSNAKSEFISIASHQLRTPLTAIKGYISMILEGTYGRISQTVESPMRKVYASNERLISLVNNLLSISRIEAGKIGFNPERTSIENVISNIVDIFEIEAEKHKLYLKFEKPKKSLPKTMVDIEKITDVLSNVINNCIKYTQKGGIVIEAKQEKNMIRVIVSDTGAGMTEEELSKMFKSFSRGMAGTKLYTEGAGLGLYVAKKYMEMHQGNIWAESEGEGKGSTFYIEIPIK